MKKLFICADMEGTCGITHWDETERIHPDYAYFADQMTREVSAACEGAREAGYNQVVVKDAHDSARNLNPRLLPDHARVLRGWGGHPYMMMLGLDHSFDGVVFTGCHNAAGTDSNNLAHTMTRSVFELRINGETASELYINALTASLEGVPVYAVSGDEGVCAWIQDKSPFTKAIPLNSGIGAAVSSLHPNEAVRLIRETVREALKQPKEACLFPMPKRFEVEVTFREHAMAKRLSFYPGIQQSGTRTLVYRSDDYFEVLRMMHFVL